jgi:hypothetical protein
VYKNRCCYNVRFALTLTLLLLSVALPRPASASEDGANANAEAAGERAHFVQAFCGWTPADVAQYKAKLTKVLTEASQFDTRWQAGWRRGDSDAIQMRSLRLSAPTDYEARVKNNCGRIKWQIDNSLRPRSPN